ncbi:hypothetical protein BVRB_4g094850 [Beta vulgaris subsp. vulgaris]|nr:hypothetical protein BVRB_4g094850 [Beta vulgaris subsp. vulgaris]
MEDHIYYGNCSSISSSNNNNNNNGSNSELTTIVDGSMLNFSNQEFFPSPNLGDVPNAESLGNILDDILQDHADGSNDTNTIQHPGQDLTNDTHDYLRLYAEMLSPPTEEKSSDNDDSTQIEEQRANKRGRTDRGDNREAVRKYREKLKTREAALEDEIKELKTLNQQLLKKLEGEAAMQAEIYWLKSLLVDIRGRIEGETRSFRYGRPSSNTRIYGYDRMPQCNGHHGGTGGKIRDSRPMLHGQVLNGGDSEQLNCGATLGCEPKDHFAGKYDTL